MLFSFPLPPTFGYTSYYANIGDMRNRGVELELNGTVVKTNDITWDIRLNMTNYKNKVTYLPEERKTMTMPDGTRGYSSGNYFYGEDIPLYTFYLKKYAGVNENGEALYYIQRRMRMVLMESVKPQQNIQMPLLICVELHYLMYTVLVLRLLIKGSTFL